MKVVNTLSHFWLKAWKSTFHCYHFTKGWPSIRIVASSIDYASFHMMISLTNLDWRIVNHLLNSFSIGQSSAFNWCLSIPHRDCVIFFFFGFCFYSVERWLRHVRRVGQSVAVIKECASRCSSFHIGISFSLYSPWTPTTADVPVKTLTLLGYYSPSFVWFFWLGKLPLETSHFFKNITCFFKIINILSKNCGLGYILAVLVQFFYFLLHSNQDWLVISSFGDETIFPIKR